MVTSYATVYIISVGSNNCVCGAVLAKIGTETPFRNAPTGGTQSEVYKPMFILQISHRCENWAIIKRNKYRIEVI